MTTPLIITMDSLRQRIVSNLARNKYNMLKVAGIAFDGDYIGYNLLNELVEYTILDGEVTLTNTVTGQVETYVDLDPGVRFESWLEGEWEIINPDDTTPGQIS